MSNQTAQLLPPAWTLADRLRKAREHAGFDQAGLARALGIARNSVNNYERGRTKPGLPVLRTWALECGVPLGWLEAEREPAEYSSAEWSASLCVAA